MSDQKKRNLRVASLGLMVILGMTALTAASVPLYNLFCRVTGYGGTTGVAAVAPDEISEETIQVAFNADVDPSLDWGFRPMQRRMEVHLGEERLAFFEAVNHSDRAVVGTAVFNVTPHVVGTYFDKIQCFCFDQQVLQPGERVEMAVSFFVDPAIKEDIDGKTVQEITLSYTFFIDEEATVELNGAAKSGTI